MMSIKQFGLLLVLILANEALVQAFPELRIGIHDEDVVTITSEELGSDIWKYLWNHAEGFDEFKNSDLYAIILTKLHSEGIWNINNFSNVTGWWYDPDEDAEDPDDLDNEYNYNTEDLESFENNDQLLSPVFKKMLIGKEGEPAATYISFLPSVAPDDEIMLID